MFYCNLLLSPVLFVLVMPHPCHVQWAFRVNTSWLCLLYWGWQFHGDSCRLSCSNVSKCAEGIQVQVLVQRPKILGKTYCLSSAKILCCLSWATLISSPFKSPLGMTLLNCFFGTSHKLDHIWKMSSLWISEKTNTSLSSFTVQATLVIAPSGNDMWLLAARPASSRQWIEITTSMRKHLRLA